MSSLSYFPQVVMNSRADFLPRNILPSGERNHCMATFPFLVFMSVVRVFQPAGRFGSSVSHFTCNQRRKYLS